MKSKHVIPSLPFIPHYYYVYINEVLLETTREWGKAYEHDAVARTRTDKRACTNARTHAHIQTRVHTYVSTSG